MPHTAASSSVFKTPLIAAYCLLSSDSANLHITRMYHIIWCVCCFCTHPVYFVAGVNFLIQSERSSRESHVNADGSFSQIR